MLSLAAAGVLILLGSYSLVTYALLQISAAPPNQVVLFVFAVALCTGVLSRALWVMPGLHGSCRFNRPRDTLLSREVTRPVAEAALRISTLVAEVGGLQTEVSSLKRQLNSNRDHSDLKDTQIQALTSLNVESRVIWSNEKAALQGANKSLRQALMEEMKLAADLEVTMTRLGKKYTLKEQQVQMLAERCTLKELRVLALEEKCALQERQIESLRQTAEEHERRPKSVHQYEQTIAELNDKLGESYALLAAGPCRGSFANRRASVLPPPYYPPTPPSIPSTLRRPMSSD
ncbi:hypothetical protein FA13DRAFT_1812360 [Coprinellus micaceus]|uniref:Uncharacterized protein n=1 Tax=Coprinellus micaceus TaxID=71717 RepID=A0A4Y7THT1_COPMI|nr:hypothetical protein FA13DRAFT_1812360 [Coprinellus micaceus]